MRRRHALRVAGAALGAGVIGRAAPGRARSADEGYGPLGSVAVGGTREAVVSADGATAYLALGDGYATVDVSDPAAPAVLTERRDLLADRADGPLRLLNDAKVSGDRLVVVGPAHPGRGVPHGVLIVDVSEPDAPVEEGFYGTEFPIHNCALDGRYCYLTGNDGETNPLVVVDLDAGREVARWSIADRDDDWTDVRSGLRTVHDVTVRDGTAALAYWDAGTYLLDVSDPTAPVFLGSVDPGDPAALADAHPREGVIPPGNHHYSLLAPGGDLLAVGRETWAVEYDGAVLGGPSGVDLYDVSDPTAPVRRATVAPPATSDPTFGGLWTTAHNLDLRGASSTPRGTRAA
ncbi:LVIVD repeat-containing protein [Halobaculum litoreum]|uniref:LVIVD repeat-containing protein n=1 Tax=Halobaculum litoreum TaxID=3031998 RepID=A0ABD5XM72_9EURY